jgi:hypothetical protein
MVDGEASGLPAEEVEAGEDETGGMGEAGEMDEADDQARSSAAMDENPIQACAEAVAVDESSLAMWVLGEHK